MSARHALARLIDRDKLVVAGLMSGTSADGIDVVIARITEGREGPVTTALAHRLFPHPPELAGVLLDLGEPGAGAATDRVELLARAHFALGWALGRAVVEAAQSAGLEPGGLDLIGSHGQTVRHVPQAGPIAGFEARATLQIGEPSCIVQTCGVPVVSDFRVADVAAGGLGAPLVPHVDRLLFSRAGRAVALQNFGGIGNVTYVPDPTSGQPLVAFDTGPGNMVIDALVRRITGGREGFDRDGVRARRGTADRRLIEELLADPYFSRPPPKTLGREQYGRAFVDELWRNCRARGLTEDDCVATATRFTAAATAASYRRFVLPHGPPERVIVSGGGALNPVLLEALGDELDPVPVDSSEVHGIPPLAREALAFAVLAYEWARGRPANCPEATGARRHVVLGKLSV